MINRFLGIFTSCFSFLKQFRLERILIIVLASVLLLSTAACGAKSPQSSGGGINSPRVSGEGSYRERVGQPSGAREFSDRADAKDRPDLSTYNDYGQYGSGSPSGLPPKAKELVKNADRNANRQIKDPGDLVENIREGKPFDQRVRDLSEHVGDKAEQLGEDISEGTQKNLRTLQDNARSVGDTVQRVAGDAS